MRLAVCAEMVMLDVPFEQRVRRITELGFGTVLWDWCGKDLGALAALRERGAWYSSMTGYLEGALADDDGAARLLATARQSLRAAEQLGVERLNVHGTGLDGDGLPVVPVGPGGATPTMWLRAVRTLEALAALGEEHGRVFVLENLNTAVDHPGVPFARAADTIALVEAVASPFLRLNLDLYHAQIGEGNLVQLVERALPLVGEVQVADVPGRCQPGTGEVHYPAVAAALHRLGYDGVVALEAFARGDDEAALEDFRRAFTP
ncbi:TIM barrel protein [Streptomyces sp. NP160]|uniref:TIM barrel protein n=1 Tax=Streptomyces sp. NP160 TaxID=2586637 RepID=UPI0011191157|nr:TIM barrel protein [Streptomyces sp. NP160]TNM66910.1 TIM barrel protein [Streptomyces sp. NP160]